jgi:hypothetical protein
MMSNTYSFITKSYVQHEVIVKAKSEDEAWEKFYDGEGQEEEISSDTYHEELDWTDEEEKEEQDNDS